MIFLTLLYLCFFSGRWNTLALPTDFQPPQNFTSNDFQSIFIREEEIKCGNTRSIYIIIRSCLSTIFACAWIAVHPNIPAPGDSRWAVLGRRMAIMAFVLLAPEFVIFWAGRQHYAARNFAKKHTGWTRVHAFFLIMGGFTLHKGGKPVQVLVPEELERLSEAGKIEWPTITEEEIADRSKGDYLSKTIVVFQATWFIIQCIARGVYGLTLTELEVVTIAFASLTGVIYYLWWDKPLDVHCSIPVHFLEGRARKIEDANKESVGSKIISPPEGFVREIRGDEMTMVSPNPLPSRPIHVDTSTHDSALTSNGSHVICPPEVLDQEILADKTIINPNPLPSTPIQVDTLTPDPALTNTGSHIFPSPEMYDKGMPQGDDEVVIYSKPLPPTPVQDDTSSPDPALTQMQQFKGALFGLGYIFVVFPRQYLIQPLVDMLGCNTLGYQKLRVPTFYSSPNELSDFRVVGLFAMCVSIVFGAIHCIAWSFHFPTLREQWAWRISATVVSGVPICWTSGMVFFNRLARKLKIPLTVAQISEISNYYILLVMLMLLCIYVAIVCSYIIARITLLVLPFMELRALPSGAYVQFNWVDVLLHI